MDLYRLLGRQVAYFRLKAGLSQEKLAEKTDYSSDFISLVERGVHAPTLARLKIIADTIGVEVWQLFYPLPEGTKFPKIPAAKKTPRTKSRKPRRSK